ncbi:MAG: hypothetical protein CEE43_13225 [Promethearchaeota archaeon Loki_b32]|nr:MAG: hypothetical protein CEE43_13225 [Candidatus Lokiarchaeota archaeon Loki_b32]
MVKIKCFKCNSTSIASKPFLHRNPIGTTSRSTYRREIVTDHYQLIPLAVCKKCKRQFNITQRLIPFMRFPCCWCVIFFFPIIGFITIGFAFLPGLILILIGFLTLVFALYSMYRDTKYSKRSSGRYLRVFGNEIYVKSEDMVEWVHYNEFISDDFKPLVLDKTDKVQLRSVIISRVKQGHQLQKLNLKGTAELVSDYFNLVNNTKSLSEYSNLLIELIQIDTAYFHNMLYPWVLKRQLKAFSEKDLLDMEKKIVKNSFIAIDIGENIITDFLGTIFVKHLKKEKITIQGHIFFTNYRILCPFCQFKIKDSIHDLEDKILQQQKEKITVGSLKPFLNIPINVANDNVELKGLYLVMQSNFYENYRLDIKISSVEYLKHHYQLIKKGFK